MKPDARAHVAELMRLLVDIDTQADRSEGDRGR